MVNFNNEMTRDMTEMREKLAFSEEERLRISQEREILLAQTKVLHDELDRFKTTGDMQ
jgi:hypothetical protein